MAFTRRGSFGSTLRRGNYGSIPRRGVRGSPPAVLAFDTFTQANGTSLGGKVLDLGGSWTATAGSGDVQGGQANSITVGTSIFTLDVAVADVVVSAVGPNNDSLSLVARLADDVNYWRLDQDTVTMDIVEVNAGASTIRASVPITWTAGDTLSFECWGTKLLGRLNNTSVQFTSTFNQTVTRHGMYFAAASRRLDNFQVTR